MDRQSPPLSGSSTPNSPNRDYLQKYHTVGRSATVPHAHCFIGSVFARLTSCKKLDICESNGFFIFLLVFDGYSVLSRKKNWSIVTPCVEQISNDRTGNGIGIKERFSFIV